MHDAMSPLFGWRGAIAGSDLTPTARHVALTLSLHMSERGDSCYPGIATLAAETGLHERTVRRAIDELEDAGWLDVVRPTAEEKARRKTTRYTAAVPTEHRAQSPQLAAEAPGPVSAGGQKAPGTVPGKDVRKIKALGRQEHSSSDADAPDPVIEALCEHLANRIEANGSKRPTITAAWRTATDRMIRLDHRTPEQVAAAIDWCQADEFWRANILSMPKLRDKYDQLRLAAKRSPNGRATSAATERLARNREVLARALGREVGGAR